MFRYLLFLVVVLTGYCLYINFAPERMEKVEETFVSSPEETDLFLALWNGHYPYSETVPGDQKSANFLEVRMKDKNNGLVVTKDDHWLVKSYGPTILQGDSYDKSSSIFLEMHKSSPNQLPKVNIRHTDNKTGKVTSLSKGDSENLDTYTTKILNVVA